jgi:hypothetical protein
LSIRILVLNKTHKQAHTCIIMSRF